MPAADSSLPLTGAEGAALLAPVAGSRTIVLAVSGGADSLALLDTVDLWRRRADRPSVVVATVDHGLRAGSAADAARVAEIATRRGLSVRVLTVAETLPQANLEAAARRARYRLLVGLAREVGASHVLLAHHRDDQAETVLMRLHRGSGVFGLAAMRPMVDSDGITIFRPFLAIPRSRLAATTAAAGLEPVDDPMNRDRRFLRSRVRQLMPALAGAGIGADALAEVAARCADAAAAIDAATDQLIAEAASTDDLAVIRIRMAAFRAALPAIRQRLLVRAIMAVGGAPYPPRFQRLEALHEAAMSSMDDRIKRTLGGAVVEIRGDTLTIYRESGRQGLAECVVGPGFAGRWDGRFRVEIGAGAPAGLRLAALGPRGGHGLDPAPGRVPAVIRATQPALWRGDEVVCAPTLSDGEARRSSPWIRVRQIVSQRLSTPSRFPSFAPPYPAAVHPAVISA